MTNMDCWDIDNNYVNSILRIGVNHNKDQKAKVCQLSGTEKSETNWMQHEKFDWIILSR